MLNLNNGIVNQFFNCSSAKFVVSFPGFTGLLKIDPIINRQLKAIRTRSKIENIDFIAGFDLFLNALSGVLVSYSSQ